MFLKNSKLLGVSGLIIAIALTAYAADNRTKLKPGFNLFSPQQENPRRAPHSFPLPVRRGEGVQAGEKHFRRNAATG